MILRIKKSAYRVVKKIRNNLYKKYQYLVLPKDPKIFCIGLNKTGTTSLKAEFHRQGLLVGDQRKAERLSSNYRNEDYDAIIKYCQTAQVFQDVPFSWPETFKVLDKAFPDAKFILTLRDSPEQWFHSRVKFDKKRYGGELPTLQQIKKNNYVYPGWSYENLLHFWDGDVNSCYDENLRIKEYEKHNSDVIDYFKDRNEKLIIINVSTKSDYLKFCDFIGLSPMGNNFPWKNKS